MRRELAGFLFDLREIVSSLDDALVVSSQSQRSHDSCVFTSTLGLKPPFNAPDSNVGKGLETVIRRFQSALITRLRPSKVGNAD